MMADPAPAVDVVHRIGGSSIANLRLKPAEARLNPPGISVLKGGSPGDAQAQIRAAFPDATKLHELARIIGSTTTEALRQAGFDVIADPSRRFPNHHRIVHAEGVPGFCYENLAQLSGAFFETFVGG